MVRRILLCAVGITALALSACSATGPKPEREISIRGGRSRTTRDDIRLRQPGGTDLTVHNVRFDDNSFERTPVLAFRSVTT